MRNTVNSFGTATLRISFVSAKIGPEGGGDIFTLSFTLLRYYHQHPACLFDDDTAYANSIYRTTPHDFHERTVEVAGSQPPSHRR
jgi:hypothetical protein